MKKVVVALFPFSLCGACLQSGLDNRVAYESQLLALNDGALYSLHAEGLEEDGVHVLIVRRDAVVIRSSAGGSGGEESHYVLEVELGPRDAPVAIDGVTILRGTTFRVGEREWQLAGGNYFVVWPRQGPDSVVQVPRAVTERETNMDPLDRFRVAFIDDPTIEGLVRRR